MHICHLLASHAEYGGLEKHVFELAACQVQQGHRVSVLVTAEMHERVPPGVEGRVVKWQRSRRDPRLGWELVRALRKLAPDVVHGHAHKVASVMKGIRAKLACPAVGTAHNIKRKSEAFGVYDLVTAPSQQVVDSLGGIAATVIWNSVPPFQEEWKKEAKALAPPFWEDEDPVIYAVGRLVEAKGFDLLLDALAEVPSLRLWLAGDGPLREELSHLIRERGLAERVWFPGAVSQQQAIGLMALADLFVIASRNEGGPYTLAEALRARCPVMATRVGIVPEVLDSAQMFGEISAKGIADGLREFGENPAGYRRESEEFFAKADRDLDLAQMAKKVEAVYNSLV